MIDQLWLPEGNHWGLTIEHHVLPNAGAFSGGSRKGVLHTCESDWDAYDAMKELFIERVRVGNNTQPHLLIGGKPRSKKVFVCQFIPFNRASMALQHPAGTPETNRAKCIQIEICGRAAQTGNWPQHNYKAIANLAGLITHRFPIAKIIPIPFTSNKRFSSGSFVGARGWVGHKHVPNNSHTDPGDGFKGTLFLELLCDAPHKL